VEEIEPLLRAPIHYIARYYLENRRDFQNPIPESETRWGAKSQEEETLSERFWELKIYSEMNGEKRQKGLRLAWEESRKTHPLFVFRYEKSNQMVQERLVTLEEISRIHQNFVKGYVVRFNEEPDHAILPTDKTFSILITPFYQMRLYLGMKMPADLFRMTELIAPSLEPALHQEIQRELDRATSLLMIGVDENWVLGSLRERLVRGYEKYRDTLLQNLDFVDTVGELDEVLRLNADEAQDQASAIAISNRYSALSKLAPREAANELLFKIVTLANWEGVPPRIGEELERVLNRVPDKNSATLTSAAARFYFEHRNRIRSHLPVHFRP